MASAGTPSDRQDEAANGRTFAIRVHDHRADPRAIVGLGPRVCFENATVDFYAGRTLVQAGLADVQPNCTFSLRTTLLGVAGSGGGGHVHLTVRVHFRGNGWLAPANARPQRVTVG